MKHPDSNKARLFARILPELAAAAPYFSLDAVKRRLEKSQIAVTEGSLRQYMSDAMEQGIVHDAGQGWYSRLPTPLVLDGKLLAPLIRLVQKQFPLLDFCCWSTHQINPYTHHILGKHNIFLYAEADTLSAVTEFLRDEKWDALNDPNKTDIQRLHRSGERSIILRPAITKQPQAVNHLAPPEKVLVDLQIETDAVMIMDRGEARMVLHEAISTSRISIASLVSYANRRRVEISRETDSSGPHNAALWSE